MEFLLPRVLLGKFENNPALQGPHGASKLWLHGVGRAVGPGTSNFLFHTCFKCYLVRIGAYWSKM